MFKGIVRVVVVLGITGLVGCGGLAGDAANQGTGKAEGQPFASLTKATGPTPVAYANMLGIEITASSAICVWTKQTAGESHPFYQTFSDYPEIKAVGQSTELLAGDSLLIAPSMALAQSMGSLEALQREYPEVLTKGLTKKQKKDPFGIEIAIGERSAYGNCGAFYQAVYEGRNPPPPTYEPKPQSETEDCFDADGFPTAATIERLEWDRSNARFEPNDTRLSWRVYCRYQGESLLHRLSFHTQVQQSGSAFSLLPGGYYKLVRAQDPHNHDRWSTLSEFHFKSCNDFLRKLRQVDAGGELSRRNYQCR
ncbi:MAG: hypothetical protein H6707_04145 [Deltaproteobacteria bacterium]|nr:hypothetical protein [Deltaproteobacteria bacterium]